MTWFALSLRDIKRPCKFYFHFIVSLIEDTVLSKPCLLNGGDGLKSQGSKLLHPPVWQYLHFRLFFRPSLGKGKKSELHTDLCS